VPFRGESREAPLDHYLEIMNRRQCEEIVKVVIAALPGSFDYTNGKVSEHLKSAAVLMDRVAKLIDPEAHEVYRKLLPVLQELQHAAESAGDQKLGHLFSQAVVYTTGK